MKWSDYVKQNSTAAAFSPDESWAILSDIEKSIKEKIETAGVPLKDWDIDINYGIKTGCNDAFIIDNKTKNRLVKEDPHSAEIIRPILRGKDVQRYGYDFAEQYVILASFGSHEWLPKKYPAVYSHLKQYEQKLKNRGQVKYKSNGRPDNNAPYKGQHHWLELDNNPHQDYLDDLSKQKIIWGELSDTPKFALDVQGQYVPLNTAFFMTGTSLPYLIAFLNSSVSQYYFSRNVATSSGVGTTRWLKFTIETLPIPKADSAVMEKISGAALGMTAGAKNGFDEIDLEICKLYGFTQEEVKLIQTAITA